MTKFIKVNLKKSDDQKKIDKHRVIANITEYHIISKLIFHRIIYFSKIHDGKDHYFM